MDGMFVNLLFVQGRHKIVSSMAPMFLYYFVL